MLAHFRFECTAKDAIIPISSLGLCLLLVHPTGLALDQWRIPAIPSLHRRRRQRTQGKRSVPALMECTAEEAVVPPNALPNTLKHHSRHQEDDGYIPSLLFDSLIVESSLQQVLCACRFIVSVIKD